LTPASQYRRSLKARRLTRVRAAGRTGPAANKTEPRFKLMFDQLLKLITGDDAHPAETAAADQRVAVAALLVEAARMDQTFGTEERDTIARLLTQRFELSAEESAKLIETADEKLAATAQYFRFTHELNTNMTAAEKIEVIEMLWSVAYADGELDAHEDQLIRQVAGLIHVTDRDRMLARKRALGEG